MNHNNKQIWLPVFLSISLIIGMIFGYKLKDNMGDFSPHFGKSSNMYNKLNEILYLIDAKYVDSVSIDSLMQKTVEHLIAQLDPHSSYIPADQLAGLNEELQGNYHGIGIQFELIRDTVTIISLIDGSPAFKTGLQIGDQIIKVDNLPVSGHKMKESQIKKVVRGKKGSKIELAILRNRQPLNIALQRSNIISSNIDAAYLMNPEIAYIRISKFSGNAYEEFMEHLERLKSAGMKNLILDLRDNGGGMLDDAVQIADEFLDGTKEIVRTKGLHMPLQVYAARRPGLFEQGKLVVLINENTASASEVLAGALQDWNRAVIIGRRTFGKGLVQEQFTLSDGSAVRLTVAKYYTPLGRCIQKPYKNGGDSSYSEEIHHRVKDGEIFNKMKLNHHGKIIKTNDGRVLYSEEGISPDIFSPFDSTYWLIYDQNPTLNQMLTGIALAFYQRNLPDIKALKDINQLPGLIRNDNKLADDINDLPVNAVTKKNQFWHSMLTNEMENIVAWMIWKKEGYYKLYNQKDTIIKTAISLMEK